MLSLLNKSKHWILEGQALNSMLRPPLIWTLLFPKCITFHLPSSLSPSTHVTRCTSASQGMEHSGSLEPQDFRAGRHLPGSMSERPRGCSIRSGYFSLLSHPFCFPYLSLFWLLSNTRLNLHPRELGWPWGEWRGGKSGVCFCVPWSRGLSFPGDISSVRYTLAPNKLLIEWMDDQVNNSIQAIKVFLSGEIFCPDQQINNNNANLYAKDLMFLHFIGCSWEFTYSIN